MESFFDLREFVITLLKKLKFIILFTLTISLLWGVVRFVPLMKEYLTFEEPTITEQTPVQENVTAELPYRYQARKIVHVTSLKSSTSQNAIAQAEPMEQIGEVTSTYLVYARNKDFFQPLVNEYFTQAKEVDAAHKEKMLEYNYRTKAVLSEEFLLQDFYNQISVDVIGNSFVQISVMTGDKTLSEAMVVKAEQVLSQMVTEEIGKFEYTVMEATTTTSLPSPTSGLTPKTSTTTTVVVGTRPTLRYIAVQSIKGCVWGFIVGFIVSIVLVLMFEVMSTTIRTQEELNQYGLRLLGTCKKSKKGHFHFIDRFIDKLEGNMQPPKSMEESCEFVKEGLKAALEPDKENIVLLTGCVAPEVLESYTCALQKAFEAEPQISFDYAACISEEATTFQKAKAATEIILIEEIGKSGNKEVAYEIETLRALDKDIVGFILMK